MEKFPTTNAIEEMRKEKGPAPWKMEKWLRNVDLREADAAAESTSHYLQENTAPSPWEKITSHLSPKSVGTLGSSGFLIVEALGINGQPSAFVTEHPVEAAMTAAAAALLFGAMAATGTKWALEDERSQQ